LSSNQLTDMAALNTALSPLVGTLQKLTLSSNRFTTVNDFSAFTALKSLKLNSNLLATISSSNSFVGMPALTDIDLSTNSLTSVPLITNQLNVINYDLSNNKIVSFPENALTRSTVPTTGLNANFDGQTISTFPTTAFCSASDPFYSQISLTDASLVNFNKCLFKQLKPANAALRVSLNVIPAAGQTTSTFCNCDNKVFANTNQVDLTGACSTFTDACTGTAYVDTCPTTYTCPRAVSTSGSSNLRFEFIGFILLNVLFLAAFGQS